MSKKILKVTLADEGLKGMKVMFEQPSKRMDMNFRDKHTVHYKAPVNKEITECFEGFKQHLISLCNLDANIAFEDIKITDVEAHDGWFKVGAKVRSVGVTEYITRTPKIEDDGAYDGAKDATEKIANLYKEVRSYIKEKKVMDPMQMVLSFNKNNEDFNVAEFEGKTDEEKMTVAREFLEKRGAIVIEQEVEAQPEEDADDEAPTIDGGAVVRSLTPEVFGDAPEMAFGQ